MKNPIIDSTIYYSVEFIPKNSPYDCWNQFALTRYRIVSWISLAEARIRLNNEFHFRIREL